jgi:hypothetical protein
VGAAFVEDYEQRGSGSSAENAVIGRLKRCVVHYSVAAELGALMPGGNIMVSVRFLDVTVGVGWSIYEINSSGFVS